MDHENKKIGVKNPGLHVYGHTTYNGRASKPMRWASTLIDFFIILFFGSTTFNFFAIPPFFNFNILIIFILCGLIYYIPQKIITGITLGDRIWKLQPEKKLNIYRLREPLYQCDHTTLSQVFIGSLLTTLSILIGIAVFKEDILEHPLYEKADLWKIETYIPASNEWTITPFFYTIGGWPKRFNGNTIFYTLPYESGPPIRFIGHVIAHLNIPDIKFIIEGPKTPLYTATQTETRDCFLGNSSYRCWSIREATLSRHLQEISPLYPHSWEIKWFHVNNLMLPPEDQPQGVYLRAEGRSWIEDRFILIHANSVQQSFILKRPKTQEGDLAFDLIKKSIGSLRSFSELNSGRAWVNRELEDIQLDDLHSLHNLSQVNLNLAEIQSLLISKISVDPASFDSYFHLAGTSVILARAQTHKNELETSYAIRNLQSAYHFAKDLAPNDPRTHQIQNFWKEVSTQTQF